MTSFNNLTRVLIKEKETTIESVNPGIWEALSGCSPSSKGVGANYSKNKGICVILKSIFVDDE